MTKKHAAEIQMKDSEINLLKVQLDRARRAATQSQRENQSLEKQLTEAKEALEGKDEIIAQLGGPVEDGDDEDSVDSF